MMAAVVSQGGGEVAADVQDMLQRYLPEWLYHFMNTDNVLVAALIPGAIVMLFSVFASIFQASTLTNLPQRIQDFWLRQTGYVERGIDVTQSSDYYFKMRNNDGLNKELQTAIKLYIGNRAAKCYDPLARVQLMETDVKGGHNWARNNVHRTSKDLAKMKLIVAPDPNRDFTIPDTNPPIHLVIEVQGEKGSNSYEKRQKTVFRLSINHRTQAEGRKALDDFVSKAYNEYRAMKDAVKQPGRYLYQLQSKTASGEKVPAGGGDKEGGGEGGGGGDAIEADIPPPSLFKKYKLSDDKDFDSLFFPGKPDVLRLVEDFRNSKGKFAIEGFPKKLGVLLSGPSGTGKTAFVKALATHLGRHIITIPLEKIKTNQQLYDIMFEQQFVCSNTTEAKSESIKNDKVIFLMEVDGAFDIVKSRKGEKQTDEPTGLAGDKVKDLLFNRADTLDLAGLLNALDGVVDSPGRVVIMSTSAVSDLDAALIRPGRINRMLNMNYITLDNAKLLLSHHFGEEEFARHAEAFEAEWRSKEFEARDPNNASASRTTSYMSPQAIMAARTRSPGATPAPSTPRQLVNTFQMAPAELEQLCIDNDTLPEVLDAFRRYPEVDIL